MLIPIVDEDDRVVENKLRSQINGKSDIYRVSALWITNSNGEVLLAQRKLTKENDPGLWGPAVVGTLEKGETYESNIYKEAKEEIGLTNKKFNIGPKIRVTEPRNYFVQWYTLALDRSAKDFTIQVDEVEQVKWIKLGILKNDVATYPEKYVPSMSRTLVTLC